ncbi:MAG: hypothetical protein IKX23_01390 [Treponema sp.]|nr:hypothetical protein [Treponema sp.]
MKKKLVLLFVLFSSLLITACNITFDKSVKKYIEDCTNACKVADIQIMTEHHVLETGENISAEEPVVFYIYPINHKNYELLQKPEYRGDKCFQMTYEGSGDEIPLEERYEDGIIKITATLDEKMEGKKINLSGCLWPENFTFLELSEDELKKRNPDSFVDVSFIQNTPPDYVTDLFVPDGVSSDHRHYVSFKIPTDGKTKNQNVKFEIKVYDDKGKQVGETATVDINDNKMIDPQTDIFTYYSDKQTENLEYSYTVRVIGQYKLTSKLLATPGGPGNSENVSPTLCFYNNENKLVTANDEKDSEDYEYIEIKKENNLNDEKIRLAVSSKDKKAELTCTVDGIQSNDLNNINLSRGKHTLFVKVHRDKCKDLIIERKINVVRELQEPQYSHISPYNGRIKNETPPAGIYKHIITSLNKTSDNGYIKAELSNKSDFLYDDGNADITVEKNGKKVDSNSYEIELGSTTVVWTVSKKYFKTKTFTKNYKVQGELDEPVFKALNGNKESDEVYRISYLYENKLNLEVSKGNPGNSITIFKDNAQVNNLSNLEYGIYNVKVVQERENCIKKETNKTIYVVIKPVFAKIFSLSFTCNFTDQSGGSEFTDSTIYIAKNNGTKILLHTFSEDEEYYKDTEKQVSLMDYYIELNQPSDTLCYYAYITEDDGTGSPNDPFQDIALGYSLSFMYTNSNYFEQTFNQRNTNTPSEIITQKIVIFLWE